VLDLAGGQKSRGQAAQADARGDRDLQDAVVGRADFQDVLAVQNDVELKNSAQEPKVGIPQHGEPQDAIGTNECGLRPQITKYIDAEFLDGISRGYARDPETNQQANQGE